jgi:glycosyltransferase involved in cell wall biosynthesis
VGEGPETPRLRRLAGPDVEFLGRCGDDALRALYRGAQAVLLPGEEDFGLVLVEAQACGRPVVALARGGACESVVDGVTGVLVAEPTADAFAEGLARLGRGAFDPREIRRRALRFSWDRFKQELAGQIERLMAGGPEMARW